MGFTDPFLKKMGWEATSKFQHNSLPNQVFGVSTQHLPLHPLLYLLLWGQWPSLVNRGSHHAAQIITQLEEAGYKMHECQNVLRGGPLLNLTQKWWIIFGRSQPLHFGSSAKIGNHHHHHQNLNLNQTWTNNKNKQTTTKQQKHIEKNRKLRHNKTLHVRTWWYMIFTRQHIYSIAIEHWQ